MRILIDGRLYGLENAGLGRYVINLVEYLQELDKKNEYFILLRRKYFDKLKLAENWAKILADFRHYSLAEQLKLPGIMGKIDPDVTHFPHFNVPIFWKGNFVVTIHDMLMHRYVGLSATTVFAPLYWLKRIVYKIVFSVAVRRSVKILAPSNAVKSEIIRRYGVAETKVIVTYEGVDSEIGMGRSPGKISTIYKLDPPYFIYAGNAYPHKNLGRLIEAGASLNNNSEQKVLLGIASSRNIFTQRLQKLVQKLNSGNFVKLLGFVPDHDLGSLYAHSNAFIIPSLSEGFGLPGLEAMQSGTLVLASDIPVFREVYKDVALYFNPYDFTSIQNAMKNALEMTDAGREERIEKGKKLAKTFSWLKMAKETLKIYEETQSGNSLRQGK